MKQKEIEDMKSSLCELEGQMEKAGGEADGAGQQYLETTKIIKTLESMSQLLINPEIT